MQPTHISREIDKLKNVFWRLDIASVIQVETLPAISSDKYIAGDFYYTGGKYKKDPYFLATIVDNTQENFIRRVIQTFSGYDHPNDFQLRLPPKDLQLRIPRFQTVAQLEMLLDIKGM